MNENAPRISVDSMAHAYIHYEMSGGLRRLLRPLYCDGFDERLIEFRSLRSLEVPLLPNGGPFDYDRTTSRILDQYREQLAVIDESEHILLASRVQHVERTNHDWVLFNLMPRTASTAQRLGELAVCEAAPEHFLYMAGVCIPRAAATGQASVAQVANELAQSFGASHPSRHGRADRTPAPAALDVSVCAPSLVVRPPRPRPLP